MKGEEGALEGYKKFLSGGCSMTPIELLRLCGVDMSTTRPVDEALSFLGSCWMNLRGKDESGYVKRKRLRASAEKTG